MKKILSIILAAMTLSFSVSAQDSVPVSFDECVDLTALVFRLAGAREYANYQVTPYIASADDYFAAYKEHPAVLAARKANAAGIAYDAVASFGEHIDVSADGHVVFDESLSQDIDERWTDALKAEFLPVLDDFYRQTRFHDWFVGTESYRTQAEVAFLDITRMLELDWFASFFGSKENASFKVVLCMLAGVNNYGLNTVDKAGNTVLSPVIGCAQYIDGEIRYSFNSVFPILVHEFCHSFCNPVIDASWGSIAVNAEKVFLENKEILSSQAYTNARIMMYETFVRASVIKYMKDHFTSEQVNPEALIRDEEDKGFLLTRTVLGALESYKGDFSVVADAINSFDIKKYKAELKAAEKNMVHYRCNLKNKAKNVPAGELVFKISFDSPMTQSVGIGVTQCQIPDFKGLSWSDDAMTLSVNFYVEPGKEYGFSIMSDGFTSQDGRNVVGSEIRFRTKK